MAAGSASATPPSSSSTTPPARSRARERRTYRAPCHQRRHRAAQQRLDIEAVHLRRRHRTPSHHRRHPASRHAAGDSRDVCRLRSAELHAPLLRPRARAGGARQFAQRARRRGDEPPRRARCLPFATTLGFTFPRTFDAYGAGFILGNADIRLVDLAAAYAGLARGGVAWRARVLAGEPSRARASSRRKPPPSSPTFFATTTRAG